MTASFDRPSVYGFEGVASTLTVNVPLGTPQGSYTVTVIGDEHGISHSTTATVVVRTDLPIARPPSTAPRPRAVLGTTTLPAIVFWSPATDTSSGIAGYELQASVDRGPWTASTAMIGSVRTAWRTHAYGHLYQYRLRARDAAGNWSAWADGPTLSSLVVQDRSTAVAYSGTWRKALYSGASGGSTTYARAANARARIVFSGRAVAIVAPTGPTRGSARLYIDGLYRGTISFRSSRGNSRVVVVSTTFPTLATHTVQLRLVGNGRVDLDAVVVLR
jgi:hypothetical protein